MTFSLIWKLVLRNFKSLSKIMLPFILAASVMFGLEYIMLSLMSNDYIQKRHEELPMLISYVNVIISILTVVFIIYANRFVIKQRRQEFALNTILGMERKHIQLILFFEAIIQYVMIVVLSIVGGYLFGNLIFMLLNRLVKDTGTSLMDYPFDIRAAGILLILLAVTMLILFILNTLQIALRSPLTLMRSKNAGEKKSKRWVIILFSVLGLIGLFYGYHIALGTEGVLNSLTNIFKAVFVVTISTYLLFISLTLVVLQLLQRIPNVYYKSNNFISISGMLSRMRANAVGLASIAMLCTFLMVTLGMSLTAYRGIETQVKGTQQHDYQADINVEKGSTLEHTLASLENEITKHVTVDKFRVSKGSMLVINNDKGHFKKFVNNEKVEGENMTYILASTEKDHNIAKDTELTLAYGEVALSTNAKRFSNYSNVNLMGKQMKVKNLKENYVPSNLGIDVIYLVVKDEGILKKMTEYYPTYALETKKYENASIDYMIEFNAVKGHLTKQNIKDIEKQFAIHIQDKSFMREMIYQLNGGLIFIGIVVSIVLLTGMFLILYYKQLSEGYEDKKNYHIMKQVGLPKELIKKTINKQIFWIFALPILTAIIHTAFASKIIYQMMGVLGIRDVSLFLTSYISVAIIIMLVYGLMYWITSRTYFDIINENHVNR